MSRQRRYLPSIGQLAAFEAVQRTGSTIAAAKALDLSQGTVSRLVASLRHALAGAAAGRFSCSTSGRHDQSFHPYPADRFHCRTVRCDDLFWQWGGARRGAHAAVRRARHGLPRAAPACRPPDRHPRRSGRPAAFPARNPAQSMGCMVCRARSNALTRFGHDV